MPSAVNQQQGTSLFELSIVMAISAILVATAIPGLGQMRARHQLRATRSELMASLQLARTESISHGLHALLCPSMDGSSCSNGGVWEHGWIVFFDRNKNRERSPDEPLLWVGQVDGEQQRVRSSRNRTRIRYSPLGTAPGTNLTISLCHIALPQTSSQLIVSNSGRVRLVQDAGPSAACGG